jgi:hypothetical protein
MRNLPDMEAMLTFAEEAASASFAADDRSFISNSASKSPPSIHGRTETPPDFIETYLRRDSPKFYWRNFSKMMDGGKRTALCL